MQLHLDVPLKSSSSIKETKQTRKDEIVSLSLDQVNDNADELIELRGEGRYFGVTDPNTGNAIALRQSLGPLCDNCRKRGHIRSKCKTVVCHKCGVVGDHYETQCPATVVCVRCGERGHVAAACKSKSRKRQYCRSCDSFLHGDENCPGIWRSYLTLPDNDGTLELPLIYCYNCASNGHYGDECMEQRTSRIPNFNGSAFSGINLPRYLRDQYFDRLNGTAAEHKELAQFEKYKSRLNKGHQHKSSKSIRRDFKRSKGSDYKNYSVNVNSMQPSRSGYIASKTQLKRKGSDNNIHTKPNRSGVIPKNKKIRKENYQALY